MEKFSKVVLITVFACFVVVGSAMATSLNFDQDYWTPTDTITYEEGHSFFQIEIEKAAYESDFGLYSVDDTNNPQSITQKLKIFDKNQEASAKSIVLFREFNNQWEAQSISEGEEVLESNWISFSNVFGFYYGVYTGGKSDTTLDYLWYSDKQFNSDANGNAFDTDIEHIGTQYLGDTWATVKIFLDDQPGGGDRDFNDMTVMGNDLKPVPEPGTMILLGSGLIGLAAVSRKKFMNKA